MLADPLLASTFPQFPRIASDSCMCNCCDHHSQCAVIVFVLSQPLICSETCPHCRPTGWTACSTHQRHYCADEVAPGERLGIIKFGNNPLESFETTVDVDYVTRATNQFEAAAAADNLYIRFSVRCIKPKQPPRCCETNCGWGQLTRWWKWSGRKSIHEYWCGEGWVRLLTRKSMEQMR